MNEMLTFVFHREIAQIAKFWPCKYLHQHTHTHDNENRVQSWVQISRTYLSLSFSFSLYLFVLRTYVSVRDREIMPILKCSPVCKIALKLTLVLE